MATVALPGGVVSLTAETADKLLALGSGDAGLLYLALLRHGGELAQARQALDWSQGRLDAAYAALQNAGLVAPAPAAPGRPLRDDRPPEYNTQDVTQALTQDGDFAALQRQVERSLGAKLSPADLKTLYSIYDYLGLPAEVIYLLTGWCVEETERKSGPGRRPRMSQVKKEAYRWHDRGVDTLPAAEAFLKAQKGLNRRERTLLPLLGIRDRQPLDKEREYIAAWVDWGFPDETIDLAYQKTLMKKQSMSWPYLNSILRRWHERGLHTLEEVRAGDSAPAAPADSGQNRAARDARTARNIAALRRAAQHTGGDDPGKR